MLSACRDWDRFRSESGGVAGGESGGGGLGGAGGSGNASAGGAGVGGAGGGGGAEPAVCGFIDALVDDFSDGVVNDPVWRDADDDAGSSAYEDVGAYVIELDIDDSYAYFGTESAYDLNGRTLTIEIEDLERAPAHYLWFEIGDPNASDDIVEMYVQGTDLILARHVDGEHQDIAAPVPFDADAMRFWRYREDGGTIFVETSADGVDWVVQASTPHDIIYDIRHTYAAVGMDGDGMGTGASVRISSVIGGPTTGPLCAIASLVDDFDDGSVATAWTEWRDPGCVAAETGGQLRFDMAAAVDSDDCGYASKHAFDFTDGSVSLEAVSVPGEGEVWLFVADPNENHGLGMNVYGSIVTIDVLVDTNWSTIKTVSYDPVAHRFIRVREDADTLHWEVSADGVTFVDLHTMATPFDTEVMRVNFGGGAAGLTSDPVVVEIDNLNITP